MSKTLKLITEAEDAHYDLEVMYEQANSDAPKKMILTGKFLMLNEKNKNNRKYLEEDLVPAIELYNEKYIKNNRAGGTLNHESSPDIDLTKLCHKIVSLERDKENSNFYIGKSHVLTTPSGKILESLIKDDFRVGMSSRCLGRIVQESSYSTVKDPIIVSIDAVFDPSIGGGGSVKNDSIGFVNGIYENKEYIISDDGHVAEAYAKLEKHLAKYPSRHKDAIKQHIMEGLQTFLKSI
jgi:hypothetical protein